MLQKEYDRAGLGLVNNVPKWKDPDVARHFPSLNIQTTEDILVQIAEGSVSTLEVINLLTAKPQGPESFVEPEPGKAAQ